VNPADLTDEQLEKVLRNVQDGLACSEAMTNTWRDWRRDLLAEARSRGWKLERLGTILGVRRQRVQKILGPRKDTDA
jgi:HJR/Mrr/RecB family endonuclease